MPRAVVIGLAVALVAASAGGGYLIMRLRAQAAQTSARLQETQGSLQRNRDALKQLEQEHGALSESFETLKTHWKEADEERARLQRSSAQLLEELATLHKKQEAFQRQAEEATQAKQAVTGQLATLQQHLDEQQVAQRRLEAEVHEAKAQALTPEEALQLSQAVQIERRRTAQLSEEMATLSRAYERVAQAHHQMLETQRPGAPLASDSATDAVLPPGPPRPEEMVREHPRQEPLRENPNLAARYRTLAASYAGAYQYAEAVRLYERSLAYEDDPGVHTQLAFIYGRVLHDSERAAWHGARADARDPVRAGLSPMASQRGLPRSDWRLLWRWLTD